MHAVPSEARLQIAADCEMTAMTADIGNNYVAESVGAIASTDAVRDRRPHSTVPYLFLGVCFELYRRSLSIND